MSLGKISIPNFRVKRKLIQSNSTQIHADPKTNFSKKIHLRTGLQSTGYGPRFFWISCLNPIYPIDGTLSLFPHRSTNGHFFFRSGYSVLSVYNGHLTLSQCHCREGLLCQVTPENVKAEVLDRKYSR